MAYKASNKKCPSANTSFGAIKSKLVSNQPQAEELHKTIIRKFKKRKVYYSLKDNFWTTDLGEMQLISK